MLAGSQLLRPGDTQALGRGWWSQRWGEKILPARAGAGVWCGGHLASDLWLCSHQVRSPGSVQRSMSHAWCSTASSDSCEPPSARMTSSAVGARVGKSVCSLRKARLRLAGAGRVSVHWLAERSPGLSRTWAGPQSVGRGQLGCWASLPGSCLRVMSLRKRGGRNQDVYGEPTSHSGGVHRTRAHGKPARSSLQLFWELPMGGGVPVRTPASDRE